MDVQCWACGQDFSRGTQDKTKIEQHEGIFTDMTLQWFGLLKKSKGMVDLVNVETSSLGVVTPEDVVGEHGNKNLGFWI